MTQTEYDPEAYVRTTFRALKDFMVNNSPVYPEDYADSNLQGKPLYEIIGEFPESNTVLEMALNRTIIHFEIDDMAPIPLGFGENLVVETTEEVPVNEFEPDGEKYTVIIPREAKCHDFNFDVGVWASDASGGVTSRLDAAQFLDDLFHGPGARKKFNADTGGIQIRRWAGGHNMQDKINDIDVYRTVAAELVVRVFSLAPLSVTGREVVTEEILITGNLDIADGMPITTQGSVSLNS